MRSDHEQVKILFLNDDLQICPNAAFLDEDSRFHSRKSVANILPMLAFFLLRGRSSAGHPAGDHRVYHGVRTCSAKSCAEVLCECAT